MTGEKLGVVITLIALLVLSVGAGIGAALENGTRLPIEAFATIAFVIFFWALAIGMAEFTFERLRPNDVSWKGRFMALVFGGLLGVVIGLVVKHEGRIPDSVTGYYKQIDGKDVFFSNGSNPKFMPSED